MTLRSPLHDVHIADSGRMIDFAGWRLPVHYGSILSEGRAVRSSAGMFDVSHMGRFRVRNGFEALQKLGTNDLNRIGPGRAQYTLWCNEFGGTIDDLIVLWLAPRDFLVVVNSSRRAHDWEHAQELTATDVTTDTAMITVQGPDALKTAGVDDDLRKFGVSETKVFGVACTISRTGYTGEDGVELICDASDGSQLWTALREAGVVPCGLGARDSLRMEMGYPLYGHELDENSSPLDAGLGFAIRLDDREFVGSKALAAHRPKRRLVGFQAAQRCVPAPGDKAGTATVTSGGTSVVLDAPIGLAYSPLEDPVGPRTLITRGKEIPVLLRELPLIERARPKP